MSELEAKIGAVTKSLTEANQKLFELRNALGLRLSAEYSKQNLLKAKLQLLGDSPAPEVPKKNPDLEKEIAAECKRMYKEVMQATHPDRVGEKHLELFLRAKEAYGANDVEALSEIYDFVKRSKRTASRLLLSLLQRQQHLASLERQLQEIHETPEWTYVIMYQQAPEAVIAVERSRVLRAIKALEHKINLLEKQNGH